MANKLQVANAALLKLYWVVNGQLCINVIGVSAPAGVSITQTLTNTIAAAIKSAYTTRLAGLQTVNSNLTRVGLKDIRNVDLPEFRDLAAGVPGSATGDPLPAQVALCITTRTAKVGRSNRGRVYLPGFSEGQNDVNGAANSAVATAGAGFINDIGAALRGSGLDLGVVSRPSERYTIVKTTFHADGTSTAETLSNVQARTGGVNVVTVVESRDAKWETQRRRINGRGGTISLLTPVASFIQHEAV
jgi:hypothetical protein